MVVVPILSEVSASVAVLPKPESVSDVKDEEHAY